ncbi:hypothetical protein FRB93_009371 [Tulasnella sp. JGI-2019a]|nr:hypothetical protein FRB93_009371 [Tulasnella sp. JGI-2019a]
MRLLSSFLILPLIAQVLAQERPTDAKAERFDYQSDVARLRKIVIESLYSHRDVWLRELISNANDAIEKWRVTSLKLGFPDNSPLNVTMKLVPNEDGSGGRIVIADTGIGMTPEELTKNLGTLAKSGTSEFLAKAEADKGANKEADPSLIGQFGLGFYSSFLVADDVYVASRPPATPENPDPVQHVFASSSDASAFDVYPDPRGNTIGHGTEITLVLKEDAKEYLQEYKIRDLIEKHSAFSTAHPIYLWTTKTEEVPLTPEDEGYVEPKVEEAIDTTKEEADEAVKEKSDADEDDLLVEDAPQEEAPKEEIPPQTKSITVPVWEHLNNQPPLWMRDPKTVTDEEYNLFYRATFKDHNNPVAWHHFKGDTGSGVGFRAIFFLPSEIPKDFWNSPKSTTENVRLYVKRVFITSDLGEDALPKWISWVRAIVDADDLPLNVSRETLQSTKFMAQIKNVLMKRFIQLMTQISEKDEIKYKRLMVGGYSPLLKLAAIDSPKDQKKFLNLIKFTSNNRELVTLDQYVEKRKTGQKQIFFLAGVGEKTENLAKSVFVEKLTARGYEVLLLNEPMDEILFSQAKTWKDFKMQDVAKEGLQFGDEDEEAESDKEAEAEQKTQYEPLLTYLKEQTKDVVADVVISNRLVTSPCAIVANSYGYSGNMQKLMAAQHTKTDQQQIMEDYAKKQRNLEINPRSPLIAGLLAKIKELNDVEEGEEKDAILEEELKEVASIMVDGALVRSGFEVMDTTAFFSRVDRVLRRSLGVSESAKADATVKPAPPVVEPETEEEDSTSEPKREKKPLVNLADLDLDENLADVPLDQIDQREEAPFDASKAIKVDVDDSGSGHKVGIVPQEGSKWGAESWEDKLEGDGFIDIQDFLAAEKAKETSAHDEL